MDFEPLTEENHAKAVEVLQTGKFGDKILVPSERSTIARGLRDYPLVDFMHRCLVGAEYMAIRAMLETQMDVRGWDRMEFIRDASPFEFSYLINDSLSTPPGHQISSIYQVNADKFVHAAMGINYRTCEPTLLERSNRQFDFVELRRRGETEWNGRKFWSFAIIGGGRGIRHGMWVPQDRGGCLKPLTNEEIETGVFHHREPHRDLHLCS